MAAFWLLEIDGWLLTNRQSLATSDWTLSRLTALVILPPSAISAGKNGVRHKVGRDKKSELTLDVLFHLSCVLPDNLRVDNVAFTLTTVEGAVGNVTRVGRTRNQQSRFDATTTSTHDFVTGFCFNASMQLSIKSVETPSPTCMSRPIQGDTCQRNIACICKGKC